MDEKEGEQSGEDSNDGGKSEAAKIIEQQNAVAERMEAANKKSEDILNRQQEANRKAKLAGETDAGTPSVKLKEQSDKEYHEEVKKDLAAGKYD